MTTLLEEFEAWLNMESDRNDSSPGYLMAIIRTQNKLCELEEKYEKNRDEQVRQWIRRGRACD